MCELEISLWTILHIPILTVLLFSIYMMIDYHLEFIKQMLSINIIQLLFLFVLDVHQYSLFNFWCVFISQIIYVVFAVYLVFLLKDVNQDEILLIYKIISLINSVWVVFIIDNIYMSYSHNLNLKKIYTFALPGNFIKFSINNGIVSKLNQIKPFNLLHKIKQNEVFIKSNFKCNKDCPICYQKPDKDGIKCLECKNIVCHNCRLKLESLKCPICRKSYL